MSGYTGVVVGTDGSPTAGRAVAAAGAIATALNGRLSIVTAFSRGMFDDPPPGIASEYPEGFQSGNEAHWAMDVSMDAAALMRAQGIDARQMTVPLHPAKALDEVAGDNPGSLIVVGTRGLSDVTERIVGNVPHELTHHAHADVLFISHTEQETHRSWKSAALATDGSLTAVEACRRGLALAEALSAVPTLLTAASSQEAGQKVLDATAQALARPELAGRVILATGDLGEAVADAGAEYDLLVMGNRGMSGIRRLFGSVPNTVTHRIPTDLLLVNTSRGPA